MNKKRGMISYIIIAVAIIFALNYFVFPLLFDTGEKQVSYDVFLQELKANNIEEVEIDTDTIYYVLKDSSTNENNNIIKIPGFSGSPKQVYSTGVLDSGELHRELV